MNDSKYNKLAIAGFKLSTVPNLFTLLNLTFGCVAIVCILENGLTISSDETGASFVIMPQKIYLASVFIGCAAIIDFLDGLLARILNASSPIGKHLDSLADVVSFGVTAGLIVYQFLRLAYAQQQDGLDISMFWLLPAFVIPCTGAYRLARFNIDAASDYGFKGVPIPAVGLLIASFPLIYWYSNTRWIMELFLNKWFWYGLIFTVGYLMVSTLPMIALKFKGVTVKNIRPFIIIAIIAILSAFTFKWLAVPIAFISYVILSLLINRRKNDV